MLMYVNVPLTPAQGSKTNPDTKMSDIETPGPSHAGQVNAPCNARLGSETLENKMQGQMQFFQHSNQDILKCVYEMQDKMQDEMKQKDQELQRTRQRIHHLEAELDAFRTQIFKSIPTSGVSDTSIMEEYCLLRDNLSNWIEGLPEIKNFASDIARAGLPPKEYPEGAAAVQPEILTQIVFECLWMEIFGVHIFGASRQELALLEKLHRGIHLLEPKKDSDAINKWKSDTLQAYTARGVYQNQVHKGCSHLAATTCKYLDEFTFKNAVFWKPRGDRLMEQIIKPAVDLSIKMNCAPEQYRWNWYTDSKWYFDGVVSKRDMGKHTLIDVLTHQKIRESKYANLPDDAKIGNILLVMYPALFRCGKDGQNDIQIEKAVILIQEQVLLKRHRAVGKDQNNAPSKAPGASDNSNVTEAADEDPSKCEEEL